MPESDIGWVIRSKVRAGELAALKGMFKDGVEFEEVLKPGETLRQWTPLHIACWGSQKPQYDRDIAEQLLLAAQKAGKDQDIRNAKCAVDGETPLDLVRRCHHMNRPQSVAVPAPPPPKQSVCQRSCGRPLGRSALIHAVCLAGKAAASSY